MQGRRPENPLLPRPSEQPGIPNHPPPADSFPSWCPSGCGFPVHPVLARRRSCGIDPTPAWQSARFCVRAPLRLPPFCQSADAVPSRIPKSLWPPASHPPRDIPPSNWSSSRKNPSPARQSNAAYRCAGSPSSCNTASCGAVPSAASL